MGDVLSPNEAQPAQPGAVVVNTQTDTWQTWPNVVAPAGFQIGIVTAFALPGGPLQVATVGRVPYFAFNLGAGPATTVIAGARAQRGSAATGTVIGTCDPSGEVFLYQPAPNGSGFPTNPTQGDVVFYDGSKWAVLAPGINGTFLQSGGPNANPLWASASGGGSSIVIDAALPPYNADNSGATDASTAIAQALAAAVSAQQNVYLPGGTYKISNSITVPTNVCLQFQVGAKLSIDSGKTVTINGLIAALDSQVIFTGAGAVAIGNVGTGLVAGVPGTQTNQVSAVWFGADQTGHTDTAPILTTIQASVPHFTQTSTGPNWHKANNTFVLPATVTNSPGFTIFWPAGSYYFASTATITKQGISMIGTPSAGYQSGLTNFIFAPGNTGIKTFNNTRLKDITISHGGSDSLGAYNGVDNSGISPGLFYPKWVPGKAYNVGDVVVRNQANKFGFAFQCTAAGTSAGTAFGQTVAVTNGNPNIVFQNAQSIVVGQQLSFAAQANAFKYVVTAVVNSTTFTITPTPTFTASATSASIPPANWRANEPAFIVTGITVTQGSPTVTFANPVSLIAGQKLRFSSDPFNLYTIQTVNSSTHITLTANFNNAGATLSPSAGLTHAGVSFDVAGAFDGTVSWTPIMPHGVHIAGGYNVLENIWVYGFPGNGFHINTLPLNSGSGFGTYAINCGHYCLGGSGWFEFGGNSGESYVAQFNGWYSRGWNVRMDDVGERSVFVQCNMEDCEAGLFYSGYGASLGGGLFLGGFKEGSDSGCVLGFGSVAIGLDYSLSGSGVGGYNSSIGYSGYYAPTYSVLTGGGAATAITAGQAVVPTTQPDLDEGFIWRAVQSGTTGGSEPAWYPGYGSGNTPDSSVVYDGSVIWIVDHYTRISDGDRVGYPQTPKSLTNPVNSSTINVSLGHGVPGQPWGTSAPAALGFSTNDANDSLATSLFYSASNKWWQWQHNSTVQGMAHLLDNSIYTGNGLLTSSGKSSVAFPTGFYIGGPNVSQFTYFACAQDPGIDNPFAGQNMPLGAVFVSTGNGNATANQPAGTALFFRGLTKGDAYQQWKPNHFFVSGTIVAVQPNNGYTWISGGGNSSPLPPAWPLSPTVGVTTVVDGTITWTCHAQPSDGVAAFLSTTPAIDENQGFVNLTSTSGTVTLTGEQAAKRVIQFYGVASGAVSCIVKTSEIIASGSTVGSDTSSRSAAVNTWSKIFFNNSTAAVTIQAQSTDVGVTVQPGHQSLLWSDSINVHLTHEPSQLKARNVVTANVTPVTVNVSASTSITFSANVSFPAGQAIQFASQIGVTYYLASVVSNSTAGTLTVAYSGTPSSATTCSAILGYLTVAGNDGVTNVAGDTVLLPAQTTGAQNGLYTVGQVSGGTAPLTRVPYWAWNSTQSGDENVHVSGEGTVYKNTTWKAMLPAKTFVVDTTDPQFYPTFFSGTSNMGGGSPTGTFTISGPVFSAKSTVTLNRTTATTPSLTVQYNPSTITPGVIGTGQIVVQAQIAAGTINTADGSTLNWTVYNQA